MATFYAATNSYASATDVGFSNTWNVLAFDSKTARDAFVESSNDLATRAITKREVTKYASNYNANRNEMNAPAPFSREYWGIVDDSPEFTAAGRPGGYIGIVEVCNPDEYNNGQRVFA